MPRRDCIGKRFCNAVYANWTKICPCTPPPSFLYLLVRRSATVHRGSRGSPSVERTRRDRDRLSLLVNVTVGEVRVHKSNPPEKRGTTILQSIYPFLFHFVLSLAYLSRFFQSRVRLWQRITRMYIALFYICVCLLVWLPMCADTMVPLRSIQSMRSVGGWEG